MFLHFSIQDLEQKELFYKLSNAFSLASDAQKKLEGLYAIFRENQCYYVGYSQNMASRLATHIRGKYSSFTHIYIFTPELFDGFMDFYERSAESRKEILMNNEKELMASLKPIENLAIDMDFSLDYSMSLGFADAFNRHEFGKVGYYKNQVELIKSEFSPIVIERTDFSGYVAVHDTGCLDFNCDPITERLDMEFSYFSHFGKRNFHHEELVDRRGRSNG